MPIDNQLGSLFTTTGQMGSGGASSGGGMNWGQIGTQVVGALGSGASSGGSGGAPSAGGMLQGIGNMFGGGQGGGAGALSGAASGASMGLVAGPWGAAIGGVVGGAVGFFGGGGRVVFAGQDQIPHRSGQTPMDFSNFNKEDGDWYLATANKYNVAVEDIEGVINIDRAANPNNSWELVVAYLKNNDQQMRGRLAEYFQRNPGVVANPIILPTSQGPAAAAAAPNFPINAFQGGGSPLNFGNSASPNAGDYFKGAYQGALTGLGNVFGTTKEGQQLQNEGAQQWLESHWYIPTTLALGIGTLIVMAFKPKK